MCFEMAARYRAYCPTPSHSGLQLCGHSSRYGTQMLSEKRSSMVWIWWSINARFKSSLGCGAEA